MDRKQKRREQKAKRREKVRKDHLAQTRRDEDGGALRRFFDTRYIVKPGVPDRNDREGWARFNALDLKCVVKEALQMFKRDRTLWRFIESPNSITKYDVVTIEGMLTKAAQSICCSPPYFIPLFILRKNSAGISMHQPKFLMRKESTPFGLAWFNDNWDGTQTQATIGGETRLFAWSTHAIDRVMERVVKPMCITPSKLAYMMHGIRPEKVKLTSEGHVIPLSVGDKEHRFLLGYVPYDEHNNMAVARTFLLPTMKGTPERDELTKKNVEFQIDTMPQLIQRQKELAELGIVIAYSETVIINETAELPESEGPLGVPEVEEVGNENTMSATG